MRGQDRFKNALYDYKKPYILEGERVILIDDIVTTGASMGACATLIKGLGAKEIVGACMAVAYRDPYTPFEIGDY